MNDHPGAWDEIEGIPLPRQRQKVLGHDGAAEMLSRAYQSGRMHHAWLLTGPRGIGKATFAYQFAGYLLRNPDPHKVLSFDGIGDDGVQSKIAAGAHPNVLTASRSWDHKARKFTSRLTVDVVRGVNSFLQTTGGEGGWRIIIVDSADDLNNHSANALLKTLEEPPKQTLFLVLAHSPQGVLSTIRSRCQAISMQPLADKHVLGLLQEFRILETSKGMGPEQIVGMCGGSARRAIEIASLGVAELVEEFVSLSSRKKCDYGRLHQLCASLSPPAKSQEYDLFVDMIFDHIWRQTKQASLNRQHKSQYVENYSRLWEWLNEQHQKVIYWNMDKKQLLLELFTGLRAL